MAKQTDIAKFSDEVKTERPPIYEGVEKIEIEELIKEDIIIEEYTELPSRFDNRRFLIVKAKWKGEDITFSASSPAIVDNIIAMKEKDKLPMLFRIIQKKSKTGRQYFAFDTGQKE